MTDDGVIFISIDDCEVAQLQMLLDEVFGEENFVALAPRKTGAGSAATRSDSELRKLNDYVFIYQKNKLIFKQKLMGEKSFHILMKVEIICWHNIKLRVLMLPDQHEKICITQSMF